MAPDPPATGSTDDDQPLRERVAELEAAVEQQQQTISRLLPGRRGVLKGAALLGGGGVLGALSADRASAQAAGQVGTQANPVDAFAYSLDVQNGATFNGTDIGGVGSLSVVELIADNAIVSQDTVGSLTPYIGDRIDLASGAFETIFDVADVVNVLGGVIYGPNPRDLEVSWGDSTTDEIWTATSARGQDSGDNEAMTMWIPPIKDASKLVFQNGSGTTETYGYRVLTI
jgi:hypothetical protein